ncbi:MAG: radical SAM protein [Desulfobacterales bacterium]|nr:radical SAM protein [Desulfobacterales bacterium]
MKAGLVIRNYPKEKYKAIFDRNSGFFARIEDKTEREPFWAQTGPELLDVSITNWCDRECEICYRDSNRNGIHMTFDDYRFILQEAASHNVFQIALGGGNPNQHPQFPEILEITRRGYGIVPSFTTNGRGLTKDVLEASKEYCGAVAVSAYEPYIELDVAVEKLVKYEIRTNIHFVLDRYSVDTAIDWLKNGKDILNRCNALVFLNYKPVGRNKNRELLANNNSNLATLFSIIDEHDYSFRIGFDSCSVSGILSYMPKTNKTYVEPCEAGRFSAFISENLQMYPCSFMMGNLRGESLREKPFMEIWRNSRPFVKIRNKLKSNKCSSCSHQKNCLNGCPFLSEINLCNSILCN